MPESETIEHPNEEDTTDIHSRSTVERNERMTFTPQKDYEETGTVPLGFEVGPDGQLQPTSNPGNRSTVEKNDRMTFTPERDRELEEKLISSQKTGGFLSRLLRRN
jgi:hypothetical protein